MMRAQLDGNDLDLDAVVRSRCDFAAGGQGSERVHLMSRPQANDLAVTILVDVSLSTDAWVDNRRVLDVEKKRCWFWATVLRPAATAVPSSHSRRAAVRGYGWKR